jgi:hypothetical protein
MKARSKFLLILLAIFLLAAGALCYMLSDDMTRWAVRDSIVHAAKQITSGQVLAAMIGTAIASVILVSFSTYVFDQLPHFKKRRIADQRKQDAEEITRWKARYGEEASARRDAEAWRAQAEPILAAMRNSNRNLNAQAGKVVDR